MRLPAPAATLRTVTWFAPSWPVLPKAPGPRFEAGSYLTDGWRLYRVVEPLDPDAEPSLARLEDCLTLEVNSYTPDELWEMDLELVRVS